MYPGSGSPARTIDTSFNAMFTLLISRSDTGARPTAASILPQFGSEAKKAVLTSGDSATVLDFGGTKVALNICEDVWVDEGPIGCQSAAGGAGIAINISASPYHRRKGPEREKLMQRRARENDMWLCYVNLLGGQDELLFDGSSVICSPDGRTAARAAPFNEELIIADVPVRKRRDTSGIFCADVPIETVELPALPKVPTIRIRATQLAVEMRNWAMPPADTRSRSARTRGATTRFERSTLMR